MTKTRAEREAELMAFPRTREKADYITELYCRLCTPGEWVPRPGILVWQDMVPAILDVEFPPQEKGESG